MLVPALAILVFAVAAAVFLDRAERVGYNVDEGQGIASAQFFAWVFLEGRLAGPIWDESYWTLTQPSLTRLLIGAGIWLAGHPLPPTDLEHRIDEVREPDRQKYLDPRTYRDERRLAEQRRVPRPAPEVLLAARRPMALLGAGVAALLFLLTADLAGRLVGPAARLVGGLAAAASFLAAPFVSSLIPRAHGEAPLHFFLLLAVWLGVRAARSERSAILGVLAGLAAGIAASFKLTGILQVAAFGGFAGGALALLLAARARPTLAAQVGPALRLAGAFRWGALAAVAGLAVFLAINPFLWPDPVGRVGAMLRFRQQEMFGQRLLNEDLAVPESLPVRFATTARHAFYDELWFGRRAGLPVEAVLAAVGAAGLAVAAVRGRAGGGLVGPEALPIVSLAAVLAGTAVNLGIDWDRYYLPTGVLGLVTVGVGAAMVAEAGRRIVARRATAITSATTPPAKPTAKSGSAG